MIDQCAQLVGATCLHEALGTRPSLTTDERSWAAEVRTSITEELQGMPTYLESKIEQISPGLRTVAERYLNATSELFFVMYNTVHAGSDLAGGSRKDGGNLRMLSLSQDPGIIGVTGTHSHELGISLGGCQDHHT